MFKKDYKDWITTDSFFYCLIRRIRNASVYMREMFVYRSLPKHILDLIDLLSKRWNRKNLWAKSKIIFCLKIIFFLLFTRIRIPYWYMSQQDLHTLSTLIDNYFDQHPDYTFWNILCSMTCKDGFVHSYSYFEILSKKMCVHCGEEEQWEWWTTHMINV